MYFRRRNWMKTKNKKKVFAEKVFLKNFLLLYAKLPKETETEETIVFFVTFLLLVAFQLGGSGAGPPGPAWLRLWMFCFYSILQCTRNITKGGFTILIIIIIIFIYLPSDVISQEKKTATSSRSITKASKYAIPLKPNTQTCRVKAIFSHLVRRQRRTERSSKSTATSPS